MNAAPKWILFETPDHNYDVDTLKRTCSCGVPSCAHLIHTHDILDRHGEGMRHTAETGFLHAFRKGDTFEAYKWAKWITWFHGDYETKRWLLALVLRETRNVDLYAQLQKSRSNTVDQCLRTFIRSRPLTHLKHRHPEVAEAYLRANRACLKAGYSWLQVEEIVRESESLEELFTAVWFVNHYKTPKLQQVLKASLRIRASEHGDFAYNIANQRWVDNLRVPVVVAEILCGHWDGASCQLYPADDMMVTDYPIIPQIAKFSSLGVIAPGKPIPFPEFRWSDDARAYLWRTEAAAQVKAGPGIRKVPWEEVGIDKELWALAHEIKHPIFDL